jgi:hypothetical protein
MAMVHSRPTTMPPAVVGRFGLPANAELKNWRVLRRIGTRPAGATNLVNAVQAVILKS